MNFSGSGFQPRHLISRLKTAPTFLVLALSIQPDFFIRGVGWLSPYMPAIISAISGVRKEPYDLWGFVSSP